MSTVIDLRGRHLLTLNDYSPEELTYLIDLSAELKKAKREGREEQKLSRLVGNSIDSRSQQRLDRFGHREGLAFSQISERQGSRNLQG